ncbi:33160_t:CDS:1, partial [Racocetra persica]
TESISNLVPASSTITQGIRQPLSNLIEVSNPEYHKPRGRPSKRLKSAVEEDSTSVNKSENTVLKMCGYCFGKGHNIRSCKKYKFDMGNKENC